MKISQIPNKEQFIDQRGILTPGAQRWLRTVADTPLKEFVSATVPPTAPNLPIGELCIFRAIAPGKTYLVWYDGTNTFYWEAGVDIY